MKYTVFTYYAHVQMRNRISFKILLGSWYKIMRIFFKKHE